MNEEQAIEVYRYPGVTPFSTEQKELLMGRDKDIEAFYQLLMLKQLIILYGKSGYGKSSLINAGIIPKLEEAETNKSTYFNIRLYAKNKEKEELSPIKKLLEKLKENVIEQPFLHHAKINVTDELSLWYWLKNHQYASKDATIILFFDQFEELFSYDIKEEIIPFAELLGKLLFQDLPHDFLEDAYQELWKAKENEINPERLQALNNDISLLHKKPNIKLVFSLRSDRLSLLNQLTDYLPNLQQNYYELSPITESAARLAITHPAQIINEKYTTPEFVFEREVIETIIQMTKNTHDGKIDTATLQIICRFIEEQKVWEEKKLSITGEVLGDIKNIFKDFYQTSLNKLNKEEKNIASKTIEEKFIQNNQRIPFAGDHLKQEYHLTDNILEQLEKSTLLRKERDIIGRFMYEIGHDTLIEPIIEFAKIRKQEEAQKQLRKKLFISIGVVLLFIAILLFVLNLWEKERKATDNATAMYWTSVSGKMNPIQGLRLLELAYKKTDDITTQKIIKDVTVTFFNQSNNHQFHEKKRIFDINEMSFSPNKKWLITKDTYDELKILEIATIKTPIFLETEKNIINANFSPDNKWLITKNKNNELKIWDIATGKYCDLLKGEKNIFYTIFSPDSKWVITRKTNDVYKIWKINTRYSNKSLKDTRSNSIIEATFSNDEKSSIIKNISNKVKFWEANDYNNKSFVKEEMNLKENISLDGKLVITIDKNHYKILERATGQSPTFLKEERNTFFTFFSLEGKWLVSRDINNEIKFWEYTTEDKIMMNKRNITEVKKTKEIAEWLSTKEDVDSSLRYSFFKGVNVRGLEFLDSEKNISQAYISDDGKLISVISLHQVKTWEIKSKKIIQRLWLDKMPERVRIFDKRYLYVIVEKTIIIMDLATQKGNFFSYGEGEKLDYTFEEIQEWIKVFGDKYLLPLDEEIKKKYGVD